MRHRVWLDRDTVLGQNLYLIRLRTNVMNGCITIVPAGACNQTNVVKKPVSPTAITVKFMPQSLSSVFPRLIFLNDSHVSAARDAPTRNRKMVSILEMICTPSKTSLCIVSILTNTPTKATVLNMKITHRLNNPIPSFKSEGTISLTKSINQNFSALSCNVSLLWERMKVDIYVCAFC